MKIKEVIRSAAKNSLVYKTAIRPVRIDANQKGIA
jgi:hypothetical protein